MIMLNINIYSIVSFPQLLFAALVPGGLLAKNLRWCSLPPSPDQWVPPGRARHSTFWLTGLQLPAASDAGGPAGNGEGVGVSGAGGSRVIPELSSVLVVYGGVNSDTWLNEVLVLTITHTGGCPVDMMRCVSCFATGSAYLGVCVALYGTTSGSSVIL